MDSYKKNVKYFYTFCVLCYNLNLQEIDSYKKNVKYFYTICVLCDLNDILHVIFVARVIII